VFCGPAEGSPFSEPVKQDLNGTALLRCAAGGVHLLPLGKLPFWALLPFSDPQRRAVGICWCVLVQILSGW